MPSIDSQAVALLAARAAIDQHAEGVIVLDLRALSSITDFFVIGTASSARHLGALAEQVDEALSRQRVSVNHTEGVPVPASPGAPQWVLMDCGDVVVHFFDERSRTFYRLEQLWADAPRVSVEAHAPPSPQQR